MKESTFETIKNMILNYEESRNATESASFAVRIVLLRAELEIVEMLHEIACLKQENNVLNMQVSSLEESLIEYRNDAWDKDENDSDV